MMKDDNQKLKIIIVTITKLSVVCNKKTQDKIMDKGTTRKQITAC